MKKEKSQSTMRENGVFIVEPTHGLCNRLRVIRSALNLAQRINFKVVVLWRVNDELGCKYEDLFETSNLFKVINVKGKYFSKIYCRLKQLSSDILITQKDVKNNKEDSLLSKIKEKSPQKIYIKTFDEFYISQPQIDYDWLIPVANLRKRIEEIVSQVGKNGKGIHIRRTDNSVAIEKSPIELFIDQINQDIENDSQTKFFLATDDKEVKKLLKESFNSNVYTTGDVLNRNSREGMQASVVDLFVLSKMSLIYGSHWSSFSEEAAKIGNIDLRVLRK